MVPLILYFPPITVNETIVTLRPFCDRPKSEEPTMGCEMAVASDAAKAAFRNPCGVIMISSWRRSETGAPSRYGRAWGTTSSPSTFQSRPEQHTTELPAPTQLVLHP